MSVALLKQYVGEAGAGSDASHSPSALPTKLYEILKQLCLGKPLVSVIQPTIATGVLARIPITAPDTLRELSARVDVCGSAGSTVVEVRVNTVVVGSLTFANTDPDPSQKKVTLGTGNAGVDVKDGDIVDINVSTAPTGGTGLAVAVRSSPVGIE